MSIFDDWFEKVVLPNDSYDAMRFAWEAALAQQAQPMPDLPSRGEIAKAIHLVLCHPELGTRLCDRSSVSDVDYEKADKILAFLRDRMAQQAQPVAAENDTQAMDDAQVWIDNVGQDRCGAYAGHPMVNAPLGCKLLPGHEGDHG